MKNKIKDRTIRTISRLFKFRHLYLLLSAAVFIPFMVKAYEPEKGRISISTGPYIFYTDVQSKPKDFFDQPRLGFSLIAEAIFEKNRGLEIGFFYMEKPYLGKIGSDILIQQIKRVHITTGYRYWWNKHFSTALGIFSAFSIGDVKDSQRDPGLPIDFKTSAEVVTVYGADTSVRFEFDFDKKNGIVFDTRYSLHFKPEDGERPNHLTFGIFYIRQIDVK